MTDDQAGFQSIGSRLRPPHAGVATVRRGALLELLAESTQRLVLLSAPAGYGKTTVVRQWLDDGPRPAAWLRLETLHNDPVALLAYLADALSTVVSIDPAIPALLRVRQPPIEERVLPGLATAVERAQPFVLVLDDAHLLSSEPPWRYLTLLLDALPHGARLAVTTRADPPLPLPRLRAGGDLLELRVPELRMSRDEAADLLRLHGRHFDDRSLDSLYESTEGWPTGLYLAMLAGDAATSGVRGDLHDIAGYLTSEVLDRQNRALREFMLRTSVLDRLTGSLCRAVTGRRDAHALLERLTRENLFVAPLDDRDEWFRYHHLFGELLHAQLLRRAPEEAGDLHRRAAAWYEAHDDLDRAVRHHVAAGDGGLPHVAEIAAVASDRHCMSGRIELARVVLEQFNDRQVMQHPALALSAAQVSMYIADRRIQRLGAYALSAQMSQDPTPVGASSFCSWQVVIRACLGPDGPTRMLEDAELACALEARGDPEWLDAGEAMRVMALYLLGKVQRASALIAEVLPRHDAGDELAWWLGMRALIAADQEDWSLAESLDAEVQRMSLDPLILSPALVHALVLAHADDPGTMAYVAHAAHDLAGVFAATQWRHVLGADVFGEAALHVGDHGAAERWTAEAETVLACFHDAGVLRARTRRLREALEERRMAEPLTPAERRVLDLLPTQLTAGQMAARLFLTQNTVKSHVQHIYRKLNATTRTAAVEQARHLGLL